VFEECWNFISVRTNGADVCAGLTSAVEAAVMEAASLA